MRKVIKRAVVFMIVFSFLLGGLPSFRGLHIKAADSDVIRNDKTGIPDKALYQMILKELGKTSESTFTEEEAQKVERLVQPIYAEGDPKKKDEKKIASIQGIEKLTNLWKLELGRNKITDLKPLKKLTKLNVLRLEYSYRIKSIEGLRNLTQLEYLALPPTVTDLSPIEGMKGLYYLSVAAGLRTLPDLTGHTELTSWSTSLEGNNLTKAELLTKLPKQLVEDKEWLKQTIDLQEYNVKLMKKTLKVTSPKKVTKITSKTKKIVGKAAKNVTVQLYYGSGDPSKGKFIKGADVDKNGVFKMKKLNLKKYKKKKLYLVSSYINEYNWEETVMKTLSFKLKK